MSTREREVMDPNATLEAIRELIVKMDKAKSVTQYAEFAISLHRRMADLDEWLSRGGFLPSAWDGQSTGHYATEESMTS